MEEEDEGGERSEGARRGEEDEDKDEVGCGDRNDGSSSLRPNYDIGPICNKAQANLYVKDFSL